MENGSSKKGRTTGKNKDRPKKSRLKFPTENPTIPIRKCPTVFGPQEDPQGNLVNLFMGRH